MPNPHSIRVACDSLVALGNATAEGTVVFAKNSDRPADECQPLMVSPSCDYPDGHLLRCTYIEIPQARSTARVLGSRPYWCWGFEHGLNEHGVAIGNHTVFTKDGLVGQGLIGMDLVRLGLERGRTADESAEVITTLLEQFGQGGSGYCDKDWPYHNSFLIADRTTALLLETSDRQWVIRRVKDVASASNHLSIGSDWESLSASAVDHARRQGWIDTASARNFDFAAAYRDTSMAPEVISSGRFARTCSLLGGGKGRIDIDSMRTALRDHYGSPYPRRDVAPDREEFFSVCMHADPVGTTTASMVTSLARDASEPLVYWASLGSPCVGIFLPLFVDGAVPIPLTYGTATPSPLSAWWQFKQLLASVEVAWSDRLPLVRRELDRLESRIAARLREEKIASASRERRESFVAEVVADALARVRDLREKFSGVDEGA